MDKSTLSQYGWVVICIIILVILIALATPFGSYVKGSVTATAESFASKTRMSFGEAGIGTFGFPDEVNPGPIDSPSVLKMSSTIKALAKPPSTLSVDNPEYIIAERLVYDVDINKHLPAIEGVTYSVDTETRYYPTGTIVHATAADGTTKDLIYVLLGDCNKDGAVDSFDTIYIDLVSHQRLEIEDGATFMAADVNCDGIINDDDYQLHRKYAMYRIPYRGLRPQLLK